MACARKTNKQKIDLLQKFISPKIKKLALGLAHKINNSNYIGWSKQMDVFAKNLTNYAHQSNLKKKH